MDYLWVHLCSKEQEEMFGRRQKLKTEDWLSIIDESAALGVGKMMITVEGSLLPHPEILNIAMWARNSHDMFVGIHADGGLRRREEAVLLSEIGAEHTAIFVDKGHLIDVRNLNVLHLPIYPADLNPEPRGKACHLPERMMCVSSCGSMYTCGCVLGEEAFCLGHVLERRLELVLDDDSLPHSVPQDAPCVASGCSGCPPLVVGGATP